MSQKKKQNNFLIINLPVWGLIILSVITGSLLIPIFQSHILWIKVLLSIFLWQQLAAIVMLLSDYKRKEAVCNRLIHSSSTERELSIRSKALRGTPCGLSIILAAKRGYQGPLKIYSGGINERQI